MSGGWWCAHAEHGARGQREESGRGLVHSRIGADLLVVRVEGPHTSGSPDQVTDAAG
jgi:hypothetical protein